MPQAGSDVAPSPGGSFNLSLFGEDFRVATIRPTTDGTGREVVMATNTVQKADPKARRLALVFILIGMISGALL